MANKYRIVKDHPDFPNGRYVLESDYSLFNGLFGSSWGTVMDYGTLEDAIAAAKDLEKFHKKKKSYRKNPTVVWEG